MMARSTTVLCVLLATLSGGMIGCADRKPVKLNVSTVAEYSDRHGQANVKLFTYTGNVNRESVRAYVEQIPCNMLYAYFYPDTISLSEIPVEEVRSAQTFTEVQDVLFNGTGYASWRFAAQCFSIIPVVTDCNESRVSQNCR